MYEISQQQQIAVLRRIEEICTRFEHEWKNNAQPEISGFLEEVEAGNRESLFFELLCIEIDHRRRHGAEPQPDDYRHTFADFESSIQAAFAETQAGQPKDGDATVAMTLAVDAGGASAAPFTLEPGVDFAGYTIVSQLGQGGMGVVYLARQQEAGRLVALKIMRPEIMARLSAGREDAVARFSREARAMGRLQHDHIVQLFEAGQFNGYPFYSMQHVDGCSLRQLIKSHPAGARQAAKYMMHAAQAVDATHQQGMTHRDITPGNILVQQDTDRAMISDFGLAKLADEPSQTATGAVFGSPPYMSPEQGADASRAGAAADIYSLGATLYHAITGRPPFQAADVMKTMMQIVRDEPATPRSLNPDIPRDLENICLKCLTKEPQSRYATAGDLAADLQRFLDGKPVYARPVGVVARTMRWARRNPLLAATSTLAVSALVIGAAVSLGLAWEASRQAEIAGHRAHAFQLKQQEALRHQAAALAEKNRALVALDEADKQQKIATAESKRAHAAEAKALHQQKLASHQLQLARKSAANQLRLYARPCEVAGKIATADSAAAANSALAELTGSQSSINNSSLAAAVAALRKSIEINPQQFTEYPFEARQKMPAAQAALRVSHAARDTWLQECNAYFGSARSQRPKFMPLQKKPGEPATTVVELEHEILAAPLYRELMTVVQAIQLPPGCKATAEETAQHEQAHRRFWQLYWGKLVFVESPALARQMVQFGKLLGSAESDETQRRDAATELIAFCQRNAS